MSSRHVPCAREAEVLEAVHHGRWPSEVDPALQGHLDTCEDCAAVAELACALREDLSGAADGGAPPTSSVMWWRLQQRARRDAVRAAARPVAMAQALALACLCGLVVGLGGLTWHWVEPWIHWFGGELAAMPLATAVPIGRTPWISVGAVLAVVAIACFAPVAIYLVVSDD